ncbi:MAG: GH116 family glycosyl hydrolase [bacterium]
MVQYKSGDKVLSGIPLGGIGAGKIEILPTGMLSFFSYQNNWRTPLGDLKEGSYGNHFAIFCDSGERKICKLLQTAGVGKYPTVESILFKGSFPVANLKYQDSELPVEVSLEATSSFVPYLYKESAIPGAVFTFYIKNPSQKTVTVALMATGRNTSGSLNNNIGRYNEVFEDDEALGVTFYSTKPLAHDFAAGELSISAEKKSGDVSYMGEWNLKKQSFMTALTAIRLDAWKYFSADGTLPNTNTKKVVEGQGEDLAAAVSVKCTLEAGQQKQIKFFYSWYAPNHYEGHIYEKWFKSSREVGKFLRDNADSLREKTLAWHEIIDKSPVDGWLKDALKNNLYVMFSSSWWTRDDKFSLYEAPMICPLMGTLDVRFYGSIPVALLFPELDRRAILQFSQAQRDDGYLPHDLGWERLDLANDGTTSPPKWKDLNSKFVLMAYRDYLWSGNEFTVKDLYPSIKKAIRWLFTTDKNGDGLPDNEGADQTFDLWEFFDTNAYTSGLFLAALKAATKIAKLNDDEGFASECRQWFEKGQKSFEEQLWTGKFYKNCSGSERRDISCTLSQLNGQWYAHMLGLGYIVNPERVKQALESIFELNVSKCQYGGLNSVLPDGTIDDSSGHSRVIWPAMNYALCALAIYEDMADKGLEVAKKVWDNISLGVKNPWNQSDVVNATDGSYGFGDYYMRNMAIWAIYIALASKNDAIRQSLQQLKKNALGEK